MSNIERKSKANANANNETSSRTHQQINISSSNSSTMDPEKKRSRIDSFAAALASRSRTTGEQEQMQTSQVDFNLSTIISKKLLSNCHICGLNLNSLEEGRKCSICNKIVHINCDDEELGTTFGTYNCVTCRNSPLIGDDAKLYQIQQSGNLDNISDEEFGDQLEHKYSGNFNEVNATTSTTKLAAEYSTSDNMNEFYSGFSTPLDDPTPTTASNSVRGSKTPTPQPEGTGSDNDEYQPPGVNRKSETARGSRGKGKGKKPANASMESGRQTTMKTRSGGKPPTTSYAAKFTTAYSLEISAERIGGQRARGKGSKGKGSCRGRRNAGRGGKLISMYTSSGIIGNGGLRRESGQRENSEDVAGKRLSPEKNDYIRTAVVTSINDKFIVECPNLCLICGSIGKDSEGAMISCLACAQSFHTYCVSMHDKLNMTLIKRGWRCLDCTVCEGCGSGEDESNLLLCDECDISYHIYCLDPPLGCIPSGSWRCKWCSTCIRCNVQVKAGIDLQRTEGYCQTCYSLRKCPKCSQFYEVGELVLKCQHCSRWFHGRCEGHLNEEQVENAAENAFRCSLCRPQTFNDMSNMPIIVDNVMVNKSMVEQIHGIRRHPFFGDQLANISRSFSNDHDDAEMDDQLIPPGLYSMRGRGGSARGGGPGRRVLKLGVGGFTVRNPKSRLLAIGQPANMSVEDDLQMQTTQGTEEDGKQQKIRRPRKLRKPLLEDAYPSNLQEAFFGVPAVESRGLADKTVDEPILYEYKKNSTNLEGNKLLSELSEHSAELLRNEQEMDMLGDIPFVDDIGLDMDIENLDFTDLIVGGEDEEEALAADNIDSMDEGFNAGSTSSLIQNSAADVCSSSASSNRVPSRANDPMNHSAVIQNILANQGRQANEQAKPIEQHRLSAAAQAAELWEEDEPLGDKATKAAVLYANVLHPNLKDKFPLWPDRFRQINKVWRELGSDKRQQFVEMARKNRMNCSTPRKRGRRTNSFVTPSGQQQLPKTNEFPQKNVNSIVQQTLEKLNSQQALMPNKIDPDSTIDGNVITNPFIPSQNLIQQPSMDSSNAEFQKRTLELKLQLQLEEDKIAQMKKEKRALAAKQRQLFKQMEPAMATILAEQKEQKEMQLKDVEANFAIAKKTVQTQQRVVDKCRQRLKEHCGPQFVTPSQQSPQITSNTQQPQFSMLQQQPSTSSQIPNQQQLFNSGNEFIRQGASFQAEKQQNLFPLTFGGVNQSLDLNSQFSPALSNATKGTRGRKRKKIRTPMLGGILFSSLQSTEEMEIYDLVDGMLNVIESNIEGKSAEALFVKRILLSQQQQEQIGQQSLGALDTLKTKKKRQIAQKGRITSDMNTEVEMLQERVKDSLSNLPNLFYSLEQCQSSDKQMLKYPNQTGLPDHNGSESPLCDQKIGDFCLPFMPDFYDVLEIPDDEFIDEESLFPPTMDEICAAVDLDELETDINDALEEKYVPLILEQQKEKLTLGLDFPFLSSDNIADRGQLVKSTLLLGNNGPQTDAPIDPHFSRFDSKPIDLDRKVDIIIDIDPSKLPREELLAHLRQLLGDSELTAMEIVTPPQTPASPKPSSIQIKSENIEQNLLKDSTSTLLICKKCGNTLSAEQRPIEEFPHRIGLTSEKEQKIIFCSMPCYFNFLAACKVPLAVELLEMAESYVDEATLERLRQISAENFAKRINAGNLPQSHNFEQSQMDNLISSIPQSSSASIAENANLPREMHIRSVELPALLQSNKDAQERKKSGNEFKWKGHGWIKYDFELIQSFQRHHEELKEKFASMNSKMFIKMKAIEDTRQCAFCGEIGDGEPEQAGRLLNVDANEWVHVNCALWSAEVHVSEEGALMNVDCALRRAKRVDCKICGQPGASIRCYKLDCANKDMAFHLLCARSNGFFIKDKTYFCANHEIRPDVILPRLDAIRRLYIHRDENQLLSKIFSHSSPTEMIMRVGSLIFQKIGQLLPDQLKAFTTPDLIFPIGFKINRFFWSFSNSLEKEWMRFECKILDKNGAPEFYVRIADNETEYRGTNPTAAWFEIQQKIAEAREKTQLLRFFSSLISGETLFGLTEPAISKMLESLPGIDQLFTYTFKHGGTPLMDVPLAENPSGCARCEPCFRTLVKRKHRPIISNSPKKGGDEKACTLSTEAVITREGRVRSVSSRFTALTSSAKIDQEMLRAYKASGISERMLQAPHLRNNETGQLSTQYKEMKKEWKENVYLARSKIQGLGLYAKRDIDMNQFIIEYIGEMIRNEVCEMRQKKYTEQNRGEYMFRIDGDWVVDATMSGGLARYINHSCDPNCGTKILTINDEKKIVIYANRPIKAGEEFTYDYQFEIEAFSFKIPCLCGAPNCARWMN